MPIHPLLARELRRSKRLQRFFDSLPESKRNEFDYFIRNVKKEETRLRRLEQTIELLTTAMEAELDPPPALKAAFARNQQARRGWARMPQSSRRMWLIEIFRSPYPETRARNLGYAILDAAQHAGRHTGDTSIPDVET